MARIKTAIPYNNSVEILVICPAYSMLHLRPVRRRHAGT